MGRYVITKLGRTVLCVALFAATFLIVRGALPPAVQIAPTESARTPVSRAITLADRHDCWSGEAPADMRGVLPGHVVVTVNGRPRYAGERMVGKALEQIFEGADHGITVHAFCR